MWELVDFEFEIFNVSEAIRLTDEPADFVVEALHTGIAEMFESPVGGDAVHPVPDCFCHGFQFRDQCFFCFAAPSLKQNRCVISVLSDPIDGSQSLFIGLANLLEFSLQIVQDVLIVYWDIFFIFEEEEPQSF